MSLRFAPSPADAFACLIAIAPSLAFAQSQASTGVIEGTVNDPSGAGVPGAAVSIKNTATNLERSLTTDADGRFRGLLLPLGPYRVTVSLKGFATLVREGIELAVGQSANLALDLKVSTVQEEVVVTADSPRRRDDPDGGLRPHQPGGGPRPAEQRPQLPRLHEAHPGGEHRAGARRRRADDQRAEGHPQQRLRGRRRLQQPVLRRAAGRPAPGLHLQPRRGAGGRGRGRGGERGVRPLERRLRQRGHEVRHQRPARHDPRLLQGRLAGLGAQERGRLRGRQLPLRPAAARLHPRGPHPEGRAVLLRGLRLPERELDEAERPLPHRAARGRLLREPRQPERERAHPEDQRRPGLPRQARLAPERQPPRDPSLQLHVGRAEERDLRRRLVGHERERGRGRPLERRDRRPRLDALALAPQRVPLPVGA